MTYRGATHLLGLPLCFVAYAAVVGLAPEDSQPWATWIVGIVYGSILTNWLKG